MHVALASFPPILALPSSSKEIWDARPAPVLALLCSAQVAGKIPLHVTLCPGCPQGCVPTHQEHPQGHGPLRGWGHLRSRGDNDTAHPVEATVSQVQALSSELHLPALEVLLVEDNDLGVQGKGWMRTGMLREGRLVLCDPACLSPLLHASPGLSKPSCRFSHLVPTHAELGSVHGHAQHRLSTGRFPPRAAPAPRWPHPGFAAGGAHPGGKELLLQVLCLHCGLLSLERCHRSSLASLAPQQGALLQWHADLASLWQFSAGPVTPSVLSTSPQDPCMQGVTRGSRWQQPTLTSQPRGEHFQSLWSPTSCPGQRTFRLLTFRLFLLQNSGPAVRETEQGRHHPHLHTPSFLLEQSPPAPEVLPLSLSPERVPARG